jgi:hypothetical protein
MRGAEMGCSCDYYSAQGASCQKCTTKKAQKRIEDLERTLKVIRTWASCHLDGLDTLDAEHVLGICDNILK